VVDALPATLSGGWWNCGNTEKADPSRNECVIFHAQFQYRRNENRHTAYPWLTLKETSVEDSMPMSPTTVEFR
jgi:hypothetical protein